jgi:hypothetical protein
MKTQEIAAKAKEIAVSAKEKTAVSAKETAGKAKETAVAVKEKSAIAINDVSEKVSFEAILSTAIKAPGVRINRKKFLRKELSKYYDADMVEKAIQTNPAQADMCGKNLERIAKSCIKLEAARVTSISAAAGIPGGIAIAATVPTDIAQFFGHVLRILQKLVYLYGWQEIFPEDEDEGKDREIDELDDETTNELILFAGVMFGVSAAGSAIAKIANSMAAQAEKTLVRQALTKGTIYPIVKKISQIIGVKMTKDIFAKGVGKVIPVVGAGVSGVVTFASFVPMAKRLQKYLVGLPMASTDFYKEQQNSIVDSGIIDIDFSDIVVEDDESIDEMDDVDDTDTEDAID